LLDEFPYKISRFEAGKAKDLRKRFSHIYMKNILKYKWQLKSSGQRSSPFESNLLDGDAAEGIAKKSA
jgi:hypothetical protein